MCECDDDVQSLLPEPLWTDPNGVPVPATPFLIPLCVTPEQYQLLIDSLEFARGLYSGSGEDCRAERTAVEIMLSAMRNVNDPITGGEPCMTVCDIVTDCVTDNEATQAAITQRIINDLTNNIDAQQAVYNVLQEIYNSGNPMPTALAAGPIADPSVFETMDECDLSKLWTGCLYLVQYIDGLITDFFEQMAELDEAAKLAAKASGAIPVIGDYVQSVAEFALALKDKLAVTYAGEMSEEVQFDIACDLFCAAQENCSLSIDGAIAVMSTRASEIIPSEFGSIIDILITHTFEGIQIVDFSYLIALSAMKFGQAFGPALGIRPLSNIMAIGAADPDDSYLDICEACPGTVVTVNVNANNPDPTNAHDSGLPDLNEGDVLMIDAPGTWNAGIGTVDANGNPGTADPSFWDPTSNAAALVGSFDDGTTWFLIGTGGEFTVPAGSTDLLLICNDVMGVPFLYADNSGTMAVEIAINP